MRFVENRVAHARLAHAKKGCAALEPAFPPETEAELFAKHVGVERDPGAMPRGIGMLGVDHPSEGLGNLVLGSLAM